MGFDSDFERGGLAMTKPTMKTTGCTIVLSLCLALSACATRQQTGGLVGAGAGAAAGAAIAKNDTVGAVVGGLVGGLLGSEIGRRMDDNDQRYLANTFETSPTGRTSEWTNPDTGTTYSATPTETYTRADRPCRNFTLEADVDGNAGDETVNGIACRRPDGTWEIVSG
jgi:surface antigen